MLLIVVGGCKGKDAFTSFHNPKEQAAYNSKEQAATTFDDLMVAIAIKESDGDVRAYNENEQAAGLYQIRPIFLRDINRILGYEKYVFADRYDPSKAKEMAYIYMCHYGKGKTTEQLRGCGMAGQRGTGKRQQ